MGSERREQVLTPKARVILLRGPRRGNRMRPNRGGGAMMKKLFFPLAAAMFCFATLSSYSQDALPEVNGKKAVQTYCVQCHELCTTTRAGYSAAGWLNNLHMMINVGAPVPSGEVEPLVEYLAKNFPERPKPDAVIVPGSAKITIKEWVVPTPGSRPHDPVATPDGAIWYTGQFANTLGRLDPKSGRIKEFRLPLKAGPHGLAADKDGAIWYTGNFNSHVGKLNPKTGEVTAYYMPNPAARDPHTPIFDKSGVLWFTVQSGNMVGRLDPKSGEIKLVSAPTPKSRPYGMVVSSKNVPFYVAFGSNRHRQDPQSPGLEGRLVQ